MTDQEEEETTESVPDTPEQRVADADLLDRVIKASGLSARRFAMEKLVRDERTVRRWLAKKRPMPEVVRTWLHASLEGGSTAQRRIPKDVREWLEALLAGEV